MEGEMEYTKGKWTIFKINKKEIIIGLLSGNDIISEIKVFPKGMINSGEALANAHLIAGAPEMYEALKLLVERMGEIQYQYPITLELPRVHAERALLKAEGK